MSGSKTPFLDAHLDLLLHRLSWSDGTPDETRTLVEGNVRGAISRLVEDGVLIPADEIDARVREIASIAEGIKAACTAKPEVGRPSSAIAASLKEHRLRVRAANAQHQPAIHGLVHGIDATHTTRLAHSELRSSRRSPARIIRCPRS